MGLLRGERGSRLVYMSRALDSGSGEHGRGFRLIVHLLVWLVILPTTVLLAVGILMLVFWGARLNVLFGILVLTVVACMITGLVLALLMLRREARLSKLQLDFVAKVSEGLRAPLESISRQVDQLRAGRGDDPQRGRACLQVLLQETGRLKEQIERLLDWGRMEAGRKIYQLESVSIDTVVAAALTEVGPLVETKQQRVVHHPSSDLPLVEGDPSALAEALVNLLANASRFSHTGSDIEVGTMVKEGELRLWVRDQGAGIPRREHTNIFRRFYRLDHELPRDEKGSGIGLSIVRHVAHGHGGRVELDSQPGLGSTFTIVLPLGEG